MRPYMPKISGECSLLSSNVKQFQLCHILILHCLLTRNYSLTLLTILAIYFNEVYLKWIITAFVLDEFYFEKQFFEFIFLYFYYCHQNILIYMFKEVNNLIRFSMKILLIPIILSKWVLLIFVLWYVMTLKYVTSEYEH